MRKELRIAVLGYGMIGRLHSLSYNEIPFIYGGSIPRPRLHTIMTSRKESAEAAQAEAGFEKAVTDIEEVMNDPEIDVVDVALPNGMHRDAVERAIAAGKHVYCEKPLAGTIEDARAISSAVNEAADRVQFGMVFQYRFLPALIRAKQLIDERKIGKVFTFRAEYLHSGYQDPQRPLSWRMKKEEGGSGALGDLGSHLIDLVRFLLGEFSAVQGNLETFIPQRPVAKGDSNMGQVTVDDVAWMQARMINGAVGSLEMSRFATGTLDDLRIWIYGERGSLHFSLMDPSFLYFFDQTRKGGDYGGTQGWQRIDSVSFYPGAKTPPYRAPIGWIRSHVENQYQFLKAVSEHRQPSPGICDGLNTQFVIDAVEKSAEHSGTWFDVETE
ncbi:Gfo/Idh/MocA family oxidoreductase [Marispirochaeta sp.]|jgi:predicted dehydrogenase|uniref:Gfo/Idh/MocA family protein n=1 Tax=Marispirochaeta sp. TaxID=2038653 RepID=UPI0029C679FB|nr:Gfo/Idh/MocA family oxidoreductase [Marispirochaeta sp.]